MGLVKTRQGDGTRVLDFMQTAGVELVDLVAGSGDGMPSLDVLDDVLEFRRIFAKDVNAPGGAEVDAAGHRAPD